MGKMRRTRKILLVVFLILSLSILVVAYPVYQKITGAYYDVVIYGGGFAGCAAAHNAACLAPGKKVLLIVPDPVPALGGLGTVGGQNFADIRYWQGQLVTAGSFSRWFAQSGQFYNTQEMAELLRQDLAQFPNLTIVYQHDLKKVYSWANSVKVLLLGQIRRAEDGVVRWQKEGPDGRPKGWLMVVWGSVFIDASDEGRLVRLAGNRLAVGREDWPDPYLTPEEAGQAYPEKRGDGAPTKKWTRQQAATLMFQVHGIKTPPEPGEYGDFSFAVDARGSWALIGGKNIWQNNPVVRGFNERYKELGFALKPVNAAQNGAGSKEWWVNMLLVFDVDGRAREMDRGSENFPQLGSGQKTVEQAWQEARELLTQPEFIQALRCFTVTIDGRQYGFGEADLVKNEQGQPVVGEIMYLRETVHSVKHNVKEDDPASELEKRDDGETVSFAVTTEEAQKAGAQNGLGADADNYADRIGLGYYMMDINAYHPMDLQKNGRYVWPVTGYVRPDWQEAGGQPANPVYLPYDALLPTNSVNLLVPGYAAGISSLAWSEVRVLPCLTVLGDAAGAAAARAVLFDEVPAHFGAEQLRWVQEKLQKNGARLEK